MRHGQAHQRQQIIVETTDSKTFGISLTGAAYGRTLDTRLAQGRPPEHLSPLESDEDDVFVVLCPELLFIDLQETIHASGVFQRGFTFTHLGRGKPGKPHYAYTAADAAQALKAGGHVDYRRPPEVSPPTDGDDGGAAPGRLGRVTAAIGSIGRAAVDRAQRLAGR